MEDVTVSAARLPSGLTLPYAESGDPSGLPVVLVHAYVESWRYFDRVLRTLPAPLHAYAPTQRGHGDADRPHHGYRPDDFARDLVDFMDVIGTGRAVLVGASSGGLVAQLVASAHPDRVCALVLISSPVTLADKPAVAAMAEEIWRLSDPLDPGFVADFVRSTAPGSVPADFLEQLTEESLKAPARTWRETLRGLVDPALQVPLERITAPTLLVSGDDDVFVRDDQRVLLHGIPRAERVVYEGVGHAAHLAHPDRVVDDIVAFLSRHAIATTG